MNTDTLVSIIGNPIRARLIRLFVLNKETIFDSKEIQKTLRLTPAKFRTEISALVRDGIIIKKKGTRKIEKKVKTKRSGIKTKIVSESFIGFSYNKRCSFRTILDDLILHTIPSEKETLLRQLSNLQGVKVLVTTGVFSRDNAALADIMIAGQNIDEKTFAKIIQAAEQLIGREFRCAIFDINDFVHRLRINDRTIRGVLDYPHFVHIDRLGLLEYEK